MTDNLFFLRDRISLLLGFSDTPFSRCMHFHIAGHGSWVALPISFLVAAGLNVFHEMELIYFMTRFSSVHQSNVESLSCSAQ